MTSPLVHTYVPWYDSKEWKNVYEQLFGIDSTTESMEEALNTLTIWKVRMPRLSSPIEGTLIVLKGILEANSELPDDVHRQMLASSVMRFLNICVASSSKNQDTMFNKAKKNKLPDWIVNIRHDFAHSQKISSKEMLIRALNYSFNWLERNYWAPQFQSIQEYVQPKESNDDVMTILDLYEKTASAEENHYSVTTELNKKFKKFNIQSNRSKYVLLQRIANVLKSPNNKYDVWAIPEMLERSGALFNFTESTADNYIPEEVVTSWLPMICLLNYYNILLDMLRMFINICDKNKSEDEGKKSAAWVKTICKLTTEGSIILLVNENIKQILRDLAFRSISRKNHYTSIYLKEILILANFKEQFITYTSDAMDALIPKPDTKVSSEIYTISNFKDLLEKDVYNEITNGIKPKNAPCQIVKDSCDFNGTPIGKKLQMF